MPDALQELLDKRALDELIYATVTAMDEGRWEAYGRGFASDVEFVLPAHAASDSASPNVLKGVEQFIPVVSAILRGFDAVQHHITNMVHTLSGDNSITTCYLLNEQFLGDTPGQNSISIGGRYEIRGRREDGSWKLTRWSFSPAWTRGNPSLFAQAAQGD